MFEKCFEFSNIITVKKKILFYSRRSINKIKIKAKKICDISDYIDFIFHYLEVFKKLVIFNTIYVGI